MLTEIELSNIRVFDGPGWRFPLPPLTVFCGTNGSGKSTILKTILLLKQAHTLANPEVMGRLGLVGAQVDLGTFQSLVSGNDVQKQIVIALTIQDTLRIDQVRFLEGLDSEDFDPDSTVDDPTQVPYTLRAEFIFGVSGPPADITSIDPNQDEEDDDETQRGPRCTPNQASLRDASFTVSVEEKAILKWRVTVRSSNRSRIGRDDYKLLLPQKLFDRLGGFQAMDVSRPKKGKLIDLDVLLLGMLPNSIIARLRTEGSDNAPSGAEKARWSLFPIPPYIDEGLTDFRRALDFVNYIGPLRAPAKRYYIANVDSIPDLDSSGEFLPYILKDKRDNTVWFVKPGGTTAERVTLGIALDLWLYYFRTGVFAEGTLEHEVDIHVTGDVLVEFRLRTGGGMGAHALADSGFGYSQVLPIVVRCLFAPQGSTLLIEQPELHLNPALQVRLAEFFVAMVRAGKQILIETHSEHIVNAIRACAAEDNEGNLASLCKVFFLQTTPNGTRLKELGIQPDGSVPDWPFEFFGEAMALSGRLLRAQKRFRKTLSK